MSKFCDKCGNEIKDENLKFCDKCGAKVQTIHNKSNSEIFEGVACKNCGTINPIGQEFCSNCGGSVVENNTTAVIIGYVCLWLGSIAIIPGIYLLTRQNSKAKTQGALLIAFVLLNILISLFGWLIDINIITNIITILAQIIETVIGYVVWSSD